MAASLQPSAQQEYDYWDKLYKDRYRGGTGKIMSPLAIEQAQKKANDISASRTKAWDALQAEKKAAWDVDPTNPAVKAEASWQEAMKLLQRQGPYTPEVVNQLTNRRADQTAAAEAVNAEEIRNTAAARGMDPTQALRQAQQQRQAQNVAFSGDIASQAAVQNFAAETPGRMAAAQANLQRQFGGATAPAVYGGGVSAPAPQRTAFASQSYNPGAVHQQAAQVRQPVGATTAANTKATTPAKPKPMDLTESQYMTPFSQRPNQNVIERTPTQQKTTLSNLNAPGVQVYKPGAFGVPRQNLQTFGLE